MPKRDIPAIRVHQWLKDWDRVQYSPKAFRARPDPYFYVFCLPASDLKALSGIYARTTAGGLARAQDLGIQRRHDQSRSDRIREFVQYGYPWSDLSARKRASGEFDDLRKPGWLPTAIVVNILKAGDRRKGAAVANNDLVAITNANQEPRVILPKNFSGPKWRPTGIPPVEVIDGQHRLWAFEERLIGEHFEVPVVAFNGLDISWQAYLFWSINITPKRINASLAFDLYPLLRTEDWLDRLEGHPIYRETRAQELTEALWSHPDSPWYHRINMLGEKGLDAPMVTQAAWIRSLMGTYVRAGRPPLGGLFGGAISGTGEVLPWSRAQQAAFLILMGQRLQSAVTGTKHAWAEALRRSEQPRVVADKRFDPAFAGGHTLLNTDQGIRGLLQVTNDACFVRAQHLGLERWRTEDNGAAADEEAVSRALKSLRKEPAEQFLDDMGRRLAAYDWRTAAAEGLTEQQKRERLVFRGSGGYSELRKQLLKHCSSGTGDVAKAAQQVLKHFE